ncbi:MAG: hypothetical protein HY854_02760 [Burkholderiales bacterium]|nr:hypothetical protein [Burkholderiales bacterium]
MRRYGCALLAICFCAATAAAQTRLPPDREQLERKLTSTATLIESSSGAKQVEAAGTPAAATQRTRARELHKQAAEALRAGQLEGAAKLLDEASRAMFEGVRLAAGEHLERKQRTDFEARLESTRALLDALKRVAAEKNTTAREPQQRVEALLVQAADAARAGRIAEARQVVDQAYQAVRGAISVLRDGDTVVRSLNFASKAAEYEYEVDRNETHRMLVQVLLKDKRGAAATNAMVEQALNAAAGLRQQAEQEAARRDHEAAVKTLEQSTRELVRAIRAAGVYIPG